MRVLAALLSGEPAAGAQPQAADLLVVNGNPLANLHLLNPYGTDLMTIDGKVVKKSKVSDEVTTKPVTRVLV